MNQIFSTILANKHTSSAALVFGVIKVGGRIAVTWYPQKADAIKATTDALESLAVLYLGFAAGDASKSASKQDVAQAVRTGDTSFLTKPPETPTPTNKNI